MNRNERRRAAKTEPVQAAVLNKAFVLFQAGDLAGAETAYRNILAREPEQPDAIRLLGEVLINLGKHQEAVILLRRLVALHPGHFISHYTLANAFRLSGRFDEALLSYQTAIGMNEKFAGAHHGMGAALRVAGREREAAASFAAAAKAEPGWALAWDELGMTLAMLGDMGLAAEALRRALAINPNLAETRRHLLAIQAEPAPDEITKLQNLVSNPATPPMAFVDSAFALGKYYDKAGQYNEAFAQFAKANKTLRALQAKAGIEFDAARLKQDVDKLIATYSGESLASRANWGDASETPVFIVGMPRSGTSLLEQILASHGRAFGAGEIKNIGGIAAKVGWAPSAAWTTESIKAHAQNYLAALTKNAGSALRVSDKMPDNIFQLGLIAALFPNSRIIFCARDALDTCFSCFSQRFNEPHGFDTDLTDCGIRMREVERLTRHWRSVLPLKMLQVSYEKLVTNAEGESRRLIEFLGLDWDPACLEFYRAKRVVKTASWAQVRQPSYQYAVGRAQNYMHHLGPLIEGLKSV